MTDPRRSLQEGATQVYHHDADFQIITLEEFARLERISVFGLNVFWNEMQGLKLLSSSLYAPDLQPFQILPRGGNVKAEVDIRRQWLAGDEAAADPYILASALAVFHEERLEATQEESAPLVETKAIGELLERAAMNSSRQCAGCGVAWKLGIIFLNH